VVGTVAPVLASGVLFAVTRSPFTLVFALLGPVVALGSLADSAWQRRRSGSADAKRFDSALARAHHEIDEAHAAERAALDRRFPRAMSFASARRPPPTGSVERSGTDRDGAERVRLGSGSLAASVSIEGSDAGHEHELDGRLVHLHGRAGVLTGAPITTGVRAGIAVVGPRVPAMAAVRGILIQLVAGRSPATTSIAAPSDAAWNWLASLPHSITRTAPAGRVEIIAGAETVVIALAGSDSEVFHGFEVIVVVEPAGVARIVAGVGVERDLRFQPEFLGLEVAHRAALALAERWGSTPGAAAIPVEVRFSDLSHSADSGVLAATIGRDGVGPAIVDLVRDGPHAIVGGTTGSGKSELLVSWVLAIAAERAPATVTFLFVDFKGGAAFEPLARLPHSVGIITDLDAAQSLRALVSLGAELRFRESRLAECGLRSIDDAIEDPPFPRLVVVVDEYAALQREAAPSAFILYCAPSGRRESCATASWRIARCESRSAC
jgi:S-DNA-T family DNA segregation ATPase FtsK/SpoIIIE